jgi:carboxylesterase type B
VLDLWYSLAESTLTVGGAFSIGANSEPPYNGFRTVELSMKLNKPVVFVALNYRVNFFGFLASKELAADNAKHEGGVGNYGLSLYPRAG